MLSLAISSKMKQGKKLLNILCLLLFTLTIQANDNNPTTLAQAEKWLSTANEKGFLENQGQMMDNEGKPVPQVLFKTEAPDLNIWVTENGLTIQTLRLRKEPIPESELSEFEKEEVKRTGEAKSINYFDWERVDIDMKGANIKKENILKENPLQGNDNYFNPTCPNGIYGVREYEKITIKDVYPGIDWVLFRNKDKGFKYDFIVHPGADYHQIELIYKSKTPININEQGELEMFTIYGNIKENTPVSFYENQEIATRFTQNYQKHTEINGDNGYETSISFSLNTSLNTQHSTLIIDPQLTWATFYGGNGIDIPHSLDTDNSGNVFVTGSTSSTNFPVQNAGTFFQGTNAGLADAFVLKFGNHGNRLWATYYGGNGDDVGWSITTDNNGNVFVTGWTSSTNFPVQNVGTFFQGANAGNSDIFILKFDNLGNRLWATYYGGDGGDLAYSVASDNSGNIFLTGLTQSTNFPVQDAGTFFQGVANSSEVFVLKFDNNGSRLWATHYGGSFAEWGYSITTDNSGNIFVTGHTNSTNFPVQNAGTFFQGTFSGGDSDVFILKFDNNGNRLWATYYGGSANDMGYSIAADNSGNIFITGRTRSTNFPVQNAGTFFQGTNAGSEDAFILKFDNIGNRLWATYFGGSGSESVFTFNNLAITSCGKVYMYFETTSTALPIQSPCDAGGYFGNTYNSGYRDIFLILFSNVGNLLWSTYMGGDGVDLGGALALDPNDNLFLAGEWNYVTNDATYPVTNPGGGAYYDDTFNGGTDDGYILKFCSNNCVCSTYNGCFVCIEDTLIQNLVICQGNSVTVGTNTYTTTGTFKDTLTNIMGCDSIIMTNLTVAPITYTNIDEFICQGDSIYLSGSFQNSVGIYYDTLAGSLNCDSILITNLQIKPKPSVPIGNDTIVCYNDGIPNLNISNSSGGNIEWYSDVNNINLIHNGNSFTPPIHQEGIYNYYIKEVLNGCYSDVFVLTLQINKPTATINPSTNSGFIPLEIQFGNGSSNAETYLWDFGNGDTSNIFEPKYNYLTTNLYTVSLTVTDTLGCFDKTTITILVEEEIIVSVPNTITPNGDGANDYWVIENIEKFPNNEVEIFNRNGNSIYKSINYTNNWNGTYHGNNLPATTYYYVIDLNNGSGVLKGDLSIIREK